MSRTVRWTEEQYLEHLAQKKQSHQKKTNQEEKNQNANDGLATPKAEPKKTKNKPKKTTENSDQGDQAQSQSALASALSLLGLNDRLGGKKKRKKKINKDVEGEEPGAEGEAVKKKRRGVETKAIFDSLSKSKPEIFFNDTSLMINVPGGRLLTYNEMFSILQFRKYEAFRYKKICREVIERAVKNQSNLPFFNSATRLTLVRVGSKEMDMDALPVVFKYMLDSLKKFGIIDDDNPNTIVEIVCHQEKGEPNLMMRLDRLDQWRKTKTPQWSDWVGNEINLPRKRKAKSKK